MDKVTSTDTDTMKTVVTVDEEKAIFLILLYYIYIILLLLFFFNKLFMINNIVYVQCSFLASDFNNIRYTEIICAIKL